jgi:hypothetical protein
MPVVLLGHFSSAGLARFVAKRRRLVAFLFPAAGIPVFSSGALSVVGCGRVVVGPATFLAQAGENRPLA